MKIAALVVIALTLSMYSGALQAQADPQGSANKGQKTVSVTGCLTLADGRGVVKQYLIKDGEMSYEVVPDNVNLNEHLGHKVTISGISMKGEGPHDDDRIRVSKITMLSVKCP